MNNTNNETVCCPKFDPTLWDNKTFKWHNKKFAVGHVCTVFYMPLNYGGVMAKLGKKIDAAGAHIEDWMGLSDHVSQWKMDLLLAVDKDVPGSEMRTLDGTFTMKVYEGAFKNTGVWRNDFVQYLAEKGIKSKKIYMWYTTCPKCAKKYGKNYVALVAEHAV